MHDSFFQSSADKSSTCYFWRFQNGEKIPKPNVFSFFNSKITEAILEEITDHFIIGTYFLIQLWNLWLHRRRQVRKGHCTEGYSSSFCFKTKFLNNWVPTTNTSRLRRGKWSWFNKVVKLLLLQHSCPEEDCNVYGHFLNCFTKLEIVHRASI